MIDRDTFWEIIERARNRTSKVTEIPIWLIEYLKQKPVSDILDFSEREMELRVQAHDALLWIAAELMMGGCGDDSFVDFRGWLICQGQLVYGKALDNPDTLADLDGNNGEHGEPLLFSFGSVAVEAYNAKTGLTGRLPLDYSKYAKPPLLHKEFKNADADPAWLSATFPKLYSRFKERQERLKENAVFMPDIED